MAAMGAVCGCIGSHSCGDETPREEDNEAKTQPTNADRCIGETAMVTEDIDNIAGKGRVEVNGISWTARSSDGANFRKGELVTVERIEGVKLIVKAQN